MTNSTLNFKEGNDGITAFTFDIMRQGNTVGVVSQTWQLSGDGQYPVNASDFVGGVLPSGNITFADGQNHATLTVNVATDKIFEPSEQFVLLSTNVISAQPQKYIDKSSSAHSAQVTSHYYQVIGDDGAFKFNYDMFGVPDQADIYVNSQLVASTDHAVSGSDRLTILDSDLHSGDLIKIVMTSKNYGTLWNYSLHYKGGLQVVDVIDRGIIVNDDVALPYAATAMSKLASDNQSRSSNNQVLYGIDGNNDLIGGAGDDVLHCGTGYNRLTGGNGDDIFHFLAPSHSMISDFVVCDDIIALDTSGFPQLDTDGWLSADHFVMGTKALDDDDYLLYNRRTGVLRYDDDGCGSDKSVPVVTLNPLLRLTAANFWIHDDVSLSKDYAENPQADVEITALVDHSAVIASNLWLV